MEREKEAGRSPLLSPMSAPLLIVVECLAISSWVLSQLEPPPLSRGRGGGVDMYGYPEENILAQVIYAHNYDTPPSPTNALPQGRPKTNTWILRRRAHRLAVTAGCVGGVITSRNLPFPKQI